MAEDWPSTWPAPASELHTIDHTGDVLFILSRRAETDDVLTKPNTSTGSKFNTQDSRSKATDDSVDTSECIILPRVLQTCRANWMHPEVAPPRIRSLENNGLELQPTSKSWMYTDVHVRVSSKHLSAASSVFCTMFGPLFREGAELRSKGSLHIALPEDDPDAFLLLMSIVTYDYFRLLADHLLLSHANLNILTKLASLTHYYLLHKVVKMHSERWMRATSILVDLRHTYLHSDALRVLWISWVFHDRAIFGGVCRLMATEGVDHPELEEGSEDDDDLDHEKANELLIPAAVIDAIAARRQTCIDEARDAVRSWIEIYSTTEIQCNATSKSETERRSCDSVMLSSLVKNAAKIDILAPPGDTYKGSFWSLAGEIKGMDIGIPSTCSATHGVCLAEYISDEMDETYWRCEFDINDFKESRKASVFRAKG